MEANRQTEQHAPEPWQERRQGNIITDANGRFVIDLNEVLGHDKRRIVACVNACAGIPTEALERLEAEATQHGGLRMLLEWIRTEINDFDEDSQNGEGTDVGVAWELFDGFRNRIASVLYPEVVQ